MLKTRVIPILLCCDRKLVKGTGFNAWRSVGLAMQAVKVHESRQVDELIFLDIGATPNKRGPDFDMVRDLTANCFMPMTIGGGITTLDQVAQLFNSCGADKVAFGTAAIDRPKLVEDTAKRFGSQAVVVSVDVGPSGSVHVECGRVRTNWRPVQLAREAERLGAGEILLNVIHREGQMTGYDLPLISDVAHAVKIPVVAASGAGTYQHFREALLAGAHAVAAGAMFQFTEATPKGAAKWLADHGYETRVAA